MAPRTKKTEQSSIQAETLTIRPVMDSESEQSASEETIKPAKRGRPRKETPSETDMLPLTLGVILQQARQAKHMKLPSISKKLRIKETYLEALEKGNYAVFPALVYGVGFLRSYAIFLGLNPDEMIARFHRETSDIQEESIDMPRSYDAGILPSFKTVVWSLLILFFLYLGWNLYQIMTSNPLQVLEKPTVSKVVNVTEVNEPAPVSADDIIVPNSAELPHDATVVSQSDSILPAVYGLKMPARVSFVATGKTTIEIRDLEANSILLKKDLKPGDRYNPDADSEGLALKTTDAGALDVYIDGKKVKTLGKKGQTKAGIQLDAPHLLKD